MKDKLKGLLVGLTIGTMMTGTLTYATMSTSIEVYFRELKYTFDGVDKQPPSGSQGFIYNDTTYVPLRWVAESLGKPVDFDNDTSSIYIGKNYGGAGAAVVATYQGGGQVTKVELDTFSSASRFYGSQGDPGIDPAYKEYQLKQLIALKVLSSRASAEDLQGVGATVDAQFNQVVQYFGSTDTLAAQLRGLNLNLQDLRQYIQYNVLAQQALLKMVDSAAIQAEYDRQRKEDSAAFVTATVRHILVGLNDPNTGQPTRTADEALARIKEVREKLVKGGSFDELAKTYSDDPGSKDSGGRYTDAVIAGYVTEFKKAAADLPLKQLSEPVKTEYGYHLIEVESRTVQTLDQVKDQLKQQLTNTTYNKFINVEITAMIESTNLK
ncbi:peptidylprolyl isomerase [Paenibacillus koleovorans]|uniref:peptidylprolyl isomerase n=1 Tax=Paenibacillus koleovorans TaxID=121608 RepID=UPI0013E33A77|nr:peptidylprolyl isomerase [Paenibacillus koleovorans]